MSARLATASCAAVLAIGLTGCAAHRGLEGEQCVYGGSTYSQGAASCQSGQKYQCDDEGDWRALHTACTDTTAMASPSCTFRGVAFASGSATCQAGTQYRCEDGTWSSLDLPCSAGDMPLKVVPLQRSCLFEGATMASNSTICRSGSTFLCSGGQWVNLGTACR